MTDTNPLPQPHSPSFGIAATLIDRMASDELLLLRVRIDDELASRAPVAWDRRSGDTKQVEVRPMELV